MSSLRVVPLLVLAALGACGGGERAAVPAPAPVDAAPPDVQLTRTGGTPGAVAVRGDAVWVADARRGRILQLDARDGRRRAGSVRAPAVLGLAADGDRLWVASGEGTVGVVEGERVRRTARVRDPGGIAAGAGAVWVTSASEGTVVALDPRTGAPRGRPVATGSQPGDVTVAFGFVWVANTADGTVSRIDPRTMEAATPIEVAKAQVLALTAGDGRVWVATTDTAQATKVSLKAIDPEAREVTGAPIALPAGVPVDLATGLGSVWATDVGNLVPGASRRAPGLVRVASREGALAGRPVRVGALPGGVTTGAGAVWVTSAGDGTVRRVVPGAVVRG